MRSILVDAGPLIAMQDRSDKNHRPVRRFLEEIPGPHADHVAGAGRSLSFFPRAHADTVSALERYGEKYRDLPMDFADASLLWVAEQTGITDILTIDLRDFSPYRLQNGKALVPVL